MIISNEHTSFGTDSDAERYLWLAYHIFVLLSTLIGDTLILYASLQKNALKVHAFIVTTMQHIAVSDLAVVILRILPRIISLISNSWVLGDSLCSFSAYSNPVLFYAGTSFIAVLTSSKLMVLRYPIRAGNWNRKRAHMICGIIWMFFLMYPACLYVISKNDVEFDYRIYSCRYITETWGTITLVSTFVMIFSPFIIVICTTIPTLMYLERARKSAKRVGGRAPSFIGAMTVSFTAIFYLISISPLFVCYVWKHFVKTDTCQFHLYRVAIFLLSIYVMCNFYIYTVTIENFRRFIQIKFQSLLPVSLRTGREQRNSSLGPPSPT